MQGKAQDQTQSDKFKQAARDLETDNDEKRIDKTLGNIAKSTKTPVKKAKKAVHE